MEWSRDDSLGNSKIGKKIIFFSTWFNVLVNPMFTSGNVCPTLVVWGVPNMVCDPNLWCCWVVVVVVSDAGADMSFYLVESVFLHLQVVHDILEMGVGAGIIGWTFFAQVLNGAS